MAGTRRWRGDESKSGTALVLEQQSCKKLGFSSARSLSHFPSHLRDKQSTARHFLPMTVTTSRKGTRIKACPIKDQSDFKAML